MLRCGALGLGAMQVVASLLCPPPPLAGQLPSGVAESRDSVTVAPGAHYAAGSLYRAFLGSGHRDLWTTPIQVPVADLDTYAGGLTAVRLGGGTTTRTLHLDGADGRRYVFRSVDKEPADLLQEFIGTAVEGVLRDQMSSFHPSGAVVTAALLDAVEVLHPTPTLVVVPDDARLGEFREEFAGMLVLFEERPDDGPDGTAGFAGSRRIVQTDDFFEILEDGPENRLAAAELLRGRLIDLVTGDRDRSTNNHLWARFDDQSGGFLWRPVPRDRDQAFVQLDGALKSLARGYDPRLVPFSGEYPTIAGLTRNAWDIDRNFLVGLSRSEWAETVATVQNRLTDVVIDEAVRRLPAEHHAVAGTELSAALRARRDRLAEAAEEFYSIVFEYADVQATNADEVITVERRSGGSVRVTVVARGAMTPWFDRTFTSDETREVRIYARGGSDSVVVNGTGASEITVRAIGGDGPDRFTDSSNPVGSVNLFYDRGDRTVVEAGPGTRFHRRNAPRPFSWHEEDRTLDWGFSWVPRPGAGYDEDRGFSAMAGVTITEFGFLKRPYAARTDLRAGWAFGVSEPTVEVRRHMPDGLLGGDVRVNAAWSGAEILDYYGPGNETPTLGSRSFHRVVHKQVQVGALWGVGNGMDRQLGLGPVLQYLSTDSTSTSNFLGQSRPYGSGGFYQVGARARFALDGRNRLRPTEGYHVQGGGSLYPALLSVDRGAFGEIHGQVATYLSPPGGNPTLALRVHGKRVWGEYPFAEAAFLGGGSSLRAVREQRYAGDASLLGSAEVRLRLATITFPLPGDIGLIGLADRGRVFYDGETSSRWYTAYGGGISIAPLLLPTSLRFTVARGGPRTAYYVGLGAAF